MNQPAAQPPPPEPGPGPRPQPVHEAPLHRDWLTTHEVARLFAVDASTITRWADEGRLPHRFTLGGHRRYPRTQVEQLAGPEGTPANTSQSEPGA